VRVGTAALIAGAVAKAKVIDDTAVARRFMTWNTISRETIAHSKRAQPDQGVRVCVTAFKQRNLSRLDAFDNVGC
jgi:hypothetical protein